MHALKGLDTRPARGDVKPQEGRRMAAVVADAVDGCEATEEGEPHSARGQEVLPEEELTRAET